MSKFEFFLAGVVLGQFHTVLVLLLLKQVSEYDGPEWVRDVDD